MFLLFLLYFFSRLLNIFSLPIFNDEAIYLHWGQIMTQTPNPFYSLFDGKPPLFVQNLPLDPLLSGRGVSIIFGAFTLLGILKICQLLKFSSRGQTIAGLLYITSPLILFFDRMAIFDSPVSTIFIWVLFLSLSLTRCHLERGLTSLNSLKLSESTLRHLPFTIISLGLIQGIGLWLKGTSQFFLYLPFIIPLITLLVDKDRNKARQEFFIFLVSFILAQILFIPVRLQPLFAQYTKREGDFLIPLAAIFKTDAWLNNLQLAALTLFIFLTPFVIFFAFKGFFHLFKKDRKTALIIVSFSVIPLIVEIFMARYFLTRYYLFAFLPILLLSASAFDKITKKIYLPLLLVLFLPLFLSLSTIINPLTTLKTIGFNSLLKTDFWQYVSGWPSGYGVKEASDWLNTESQKQPIVVITRADSGNPEDAMFVYLSKNKRLMLAQISRQPTPEELAPLKNIPVYFVSRGNQLLNMEKSLTEKVIFKKPLGNEFVGIYELKITP
jgi:hypothetical protein